MKQIKLISALFLLVLISCTENSNSLIGSDSNNLEKKGISQVTSGGDAFTLSSNALYNCYPGVVGSYIVTHDDIITRGGGSDPMGWSLYSTSTGSWDWEVSIYINETPENGTPIYEGSFGNNYIGSNISTSFSAGEGDVIYISLVPFCWTGGIDASKKLETTLSKLTTLGIGTIHLE